MTTVRLQVIRVPDFKRDVSAARRVIDENFRSVADVINAAISRGSLIGPGSITVDLLHSSLSTFGGDLSGTLPTGTVVGLRSKTLTAPVAGDDGKVITYNHGGSSFGYADKLTDVFTTRGDLLYRGAATESRLGIGGANTILKSDGTDPAWATLTSLLDSIGSTRGQVLYRGNAAWTALDPGTSGHFLKTNGAGADPSWAAGGGGSTSPLTTKGDLWGYDTADNRLPVGTDGKVLTADSTAAMGVSWQTPAAAGTNALLDGSAHSDTVAQGVTRGSIIYGNSTPKWDELVIGASGKFLRSDGTDIAWQFPRKLPANRSPHYYLSLGGSGVIVSNGPIASTNAGGTEGDGTETGAGGRFCNHYRQATLNGVTGRQSTDIFKAERSPVFYFDFKIATVNTGVGSTMLFLAGFSDTSIGNAKGTVSQARIVWLQGTDTNFQFRLGSGAAATDNDTGVAKDANWHDCLVYTPDNGTTWKCEIDGVEVVSSTTNVPTTTTTMSAHVGFSTIGAGASNTPEIRNSYQHAWEGGVP